MDANALARHGLDKLRLGDIVAVTDYDSSYGHGYKKGGVSLGVVSSTDSIRAGYGPGVTLLMTAPGGEIDPMVVDGMNLAGLLEIETMATVNERDGICHPPDTVMGRALSKRAVALIAAMASSPDAGDAGVALRA